MLQHIGRKGLTAKTSNNIFKIYTKNFQKMLYLELSMSQNLNRHEGLAHRRLVVG